MSGEAASLQVRGVFPYSALVQVAGEDTEDNYVYCRGFDPRIAKFIDYESGNPDKPGLPVAKPYGKRKPGTYKIAQVFQALLPLQTTNPSPADVDWRIRQNPGFAVGGEGHPQDLDEKIDELYTTEGKLVNYMLVDGGSAACDFIRFEIISVGTNFRGIRWAEVTVLSRPEGCSEVPEEVEGVIPKIYDMAGCFLNEPDVDLIDRVGYAKYLQDERFIDQELEPGGPIPDLAWEIHSLCCPTCTPPASPSPSSSPSSGGEPAAMITGSGPGPIPGQFLP